MTDPVARENFLVYGNPDGYGNFHVSIALPKFLYEKDYQLHVLISFFILIIIIIPGYFYQLATDQEDLDVGGISIKNRQLFM